MTGPTGQPLSGLQLTARDIRFQRVAGLGGADVAVVELAGGTVGGHDARGAKLELPAAELNRRLANQSKGAIKALRVVTVRSDGRWRVSLLATAAEQARLAAGAAEPDWDLLAAGSRQASPGAASPEAAVRDLAAAAGRGRGAPSSSSRRPSAGSSRPTGRCWPTRAAGPRPPPSAWRPCGPRTERVADGVARVRATAGRLVAGMGGDQVDLGRASTKEPAAPTSSPSSGTGRGIHPWCHRHRLDAEPSRTGAPVIQIMLVADDPGFRDRLRLALERLELTGEEVSFLEAVNGRRPGPGRGPPARPGGRRRVGHPLRRLRPDPRPQGQPRDRLPGHPHPRPVPGRSRSAAGRAPTPSSTGPSTPSPWPRWPASSSRRSRARPPWKERRPRDHPRPLRVVPPRAPARPAPPAERGLPLPLLRVRVRPLVRHHRPRGRQTHPGLPRRPGPGPGRAPVDDRRPPPARPLSHGRPGRRRHPGRAPQPA